jgi:histidine triad (HIT) family protein
MPDCIFCSIVSGDIPASIVLRTPEVVAFTDLNPQAPTHILVVPTEHHVSAAALAQDNPAQAVAVLVATHKVAAEAGLTDYRTVFNTGADAGQSVFHAHAHVLGGRNLGWPPG